MKKGILLIIVAAFLLAIVSPVLAEEATSEAASAATSEKTASPKDIVDYTGKVATGTVTTVGEAAKETTETAVSPLVALWRSLTGKAKPQTIVSDPIEKGGKAAYDAGINAGKTVAGQK